MREATLKSGDEFVADTMSYVETKIVQDTFEGIDIEGEDSVEPVAIKCEMFK